MQRTQWADDWRQWRPEVVLRPRLTSAIRFVSVGEFVAGVMVFALFDDGQTRENLTEQHQYSRELGGYWNGVEL